jgi:hypothetical protein
MRTAVHTGTGIGIMHRFSTFPAFADGACVGTGGEVIASYAAPMLPTRSGYEGGLKAALAEPKTTVTAPSAGGLVYLPWIHAV